MCCAAALRLSNYGSVRLRLCAAAQRIELRGFRSQLHRCAGPQGRNRLLLLLIGTNPTDLSPWLDRIYSRILLETLTRLNAIFFYSRGTSGGVHVVTNVGWNFVMDSTRRAVHRPVGYEEILSPTRDEQCPFVPLRYKQLVGQERLLRCARPVSQIIHTMMRFLEIDIRWAGFWQLGKKEYSGI